jgi:hypothetical protein
VSRRLPRRASRRLPRRASRRLPSRCARVHRNHASSHLCTPWWSLPPPDAPAPGLDPLVSTKYARQSTQGYAHGSRWIGGGARGNWMVTQNARDKD